MIGLTEMHVAKAALTGKFLQERTLLANAIAINAAISACEKCKRWIDAGPS